MFSCLFLGGSFLFFFTQKVCFIAECSHDITVYKCTTIWHISLRPLPPPLKESEREREGGGRERQRQRQTEREKQRERHRERERRKHRNCRVDDFAVTCQTKALRPNHENPTFVGHSFFANHYCIFSSSSLVSLRFLSFFPLQHTLNPLDTSFESRFSKDVR